MRRCLPLRATPTALALAMLAASAGGLTAQNRMFGAGMSTGVGYTAAFPDVEAGVGAWHLIGGSRFGIFADAKMSLGSRRDEPNHCPPALEACTIEAVDDVTGATFIRDDDEYRIGNVGGIFAITPQFMFMLGGGVASKRTIREYYDEAEDPITETGQFFVDHSPDPATEIQAVAGMIIRAGNSLAFRFGYETAPGGMSLGGYFILP